MYLLDTNICIALMKNDAKAIAEFAIKGSDCYASTITLGELYKGVYCSKKVKANLTALNSFMNLTKFAEFDDVAAIEFGKIQGELRKKGRPTGDLDALIAAVARSRGDILVTHNTRHFINISGLKLED